MSTGYKTLFRVLDFRVTVGRVADSQANSEATIKIQVDDRIVHTAAEGNGPVSALDAALRKALLPIYPTIDKIQLADYRVNIIDGSEGTAATTHVLIDSRDGDRVFTTEGSSTNIIQASLDALIDSVEFALLEHTRKP